MIVPGPHVHRHLAGGERVGASRCRSRSTTAHHDARPRRRRGGDHAAHRGDPAGPPLRPAGRPSRAAGARRRDISSCWSRTPPRRTARACTARPSATSATPPPGASTRARTSARSATAGPSRPTTPRSRDACAACATTAARAATSTSRSGFNSRLDELQAAVLRVKLAAPGRVERAPRDDRGPLPRRARRRTSTLPAVRPGPSRAGTCSPSATSSATRSAAISTPRASRR